MQEIKRWPHKKRKTKLNAGFFVNEKQNTKTQTKANSIRGNRGLILPLQNLHIPFEIKKPITGSNSG